MKAVIFAKRHQLDVVELELPPVGPDDVRIKVDYVGICGSDLHKSELASVDPGYVMGHEFCGTVDALGSNVTGWKPGDRAVILPMVACGGCWGCKLGKPELCETGLLEGPGIGGRMAGGYAEYVSIPSGMLRRLPESVKMEHAVLVEPLSVGLHGVQRSRAVPTDAAMVLGGGPIGTFTAIGLRARGFQSILVVEANESRRKSVASLGFETTAPDGLEAAVKSTFGTQGPLMAYDCTGHPSGAPLALSVLKPGGTLVIIGVPRELVPVNLQRLLIDEFTITGSVGYDDRDYDEAIDHIANGRVPCDQITTFARLEEAQHWFEVLLSRQSTEIKVLLKP